MSDLVGVMAELIPLVLVIVGMYLCYGLWGPRIT
jgi:hypothetical protein